MNKDIKKIELEEDQIKELDKNTLLMDKAYVKSKIKALKKAYNRKDRTALYNLSDEFYDIDQALGVDDKESLQEQLAKETEERKKGATGIRVAKEKNTMAKLGIIDYKNIIHEAAIASSYEDYRILNKQKKDRREFIIIGGVVGALGLGSLAGYIGNNVRGNKVTTNGTTTTLENTLNNTTTSNVSQSTINEVYESTKNTSGYAIESINIDYSSPTRATTVANEDIDDGSYVSPNATVSTIRETTPNDEVTVIVEPTVPETEPVSYETSAIPTNESGVIVDDNNDPVPTTSYIEPTGTDPLPIEPSHETLSWDELMEDSEYTEVTKGKAKVLSLRK